MMLSAQQPTVYDPSTVSKKQNISHVLCTSSVVVPCTCNTGSSSLAVRSRDQALGTSDLKHGGNICITEHRISRMQQRLLYSQCFRQDSDPKFRISLNPQHTNALLSTPGQHPCLFVWQTLIISHNLFLQSFSFAWSQLVASRTTSSLFVCLRPRSWQLAKISHHLCLHGCPIETIHSVCCRKLVAERMTECMWLLTT